MAIDQNINFSASATDIPFLLLPETDSLFLNRALRLRNLAPGHAMEAYLRFMAGVANAQHHAMASISQTGRPTAVPGQPPLAIGSVERDPAWQQVLRQIADEVSGMAPEGFSTRLQHLLSTASSSDLESWAQAYLDGDFTGSDIGIMPLVAASLQVYWAALTRQLQDVPVEARHAGHPSRLCPVCSSPPAGSITHAGAASQGLRYLVCSLCSSQWNMERIRCVSCGDSRQVSYYGIEGTAGSIQAEACDACHVYTKIMHMEKDPALEILADDLATLSLDILVGEAGYQRYGLNPLLLTEPELAAAE
ncbi:protein FdhE [mine drainage metagenome]|uniref:Protein FdhE n=1 Tax=mine drainage metagenome TaxID=410659 RepID=A0A1J5R1C3_9ZZZZ